MFIFIHKKIRFFYRQYKTVKKQRFEDRLLYNLTSVLYTVYAWIYIFVIFTGTLMRNDCEQFVSYLACNVSQSHVSNIYENKIKKLINLQKCIEFYFVGLFGYKETLY